MGWAIRDEYAHIHAEQSGLLPAEASAAGLEPSGMSGDGCASLARIAGLGCRPDGGVGPCASHCHPDAEAAYVMARRGMAPNDGLLIIEFAKVAGRPDWGEADRRFEWRPVLNYRLDVTVLRPGGRGAYCPVTFWDRSAYIESKRMLYTAWWRALARLCRDLRCAGTLQRHEVTGPAAPERPWDMGAHGGAARR